MDRQLNVNRILFFFKNNLMFYFLTGVCCDACERWFHLVCVGLTSVKKKEEFKCTRCKQSSLSTVTSSISTPALIVT